MQNINKCCNYSLQENTIVHKYDCSEYGIRNPRKFPKYKQSLLQLISSGLRGVEPGDVISSQDCRDLTKLGFAVKCPRGKYYSTPKGERALANGEFEWIKT